MRRVLENIKGFSFPTWSVPLLLLFVSTAAYGLLFLWLGYYWDDWPFMWISQKLGAEGLARYFSTNRPVWGLIYQFTTSIFGSTPWVWQIFGLFWRWINAVVIWWLVLVLWPLRKREALWVALLILLYPGFDQQSIAVLYSHFFIVLTAYFLSLVFMVLSIRKPVWFWVYMITALLLSLLNLLAMEYFFLLELLRPLLLWFIFEDQKEKKQRLKSILKYWLPYIAGFAFAVIWRLFIFDFQTQNYEPVLLDQVKTQPVGTVFQLIGNVLQGSFRATFGAWGRPFEALLTENLGSREVLVYWGLVISVSFVLSIYMLKQRILSVQESPNHRKRWGWQIIFFSTAALLMAGIPFWMTGLSVDLKYPLSRFTLPFLMGYAFLFTGIMSLLPGKGKLQVLILSVLLGFCTAYQFQVANIYRREWDQQKSMFWQMSWRMPQIREHTAILANDLPMLHTSDNSLSAPVNYIFAENNHTEDMSYIFYFPSIRLDDHLHAFEKGIPIEQNYLAAEFQGNTDQVISLMYAPPACLRVLDPELDPQNIMLPGIMREAAVLSNTDMILNVVEEKAVKVPKNIFGEEPQHGWCYYFSKAELARQQSDWDEVAALGDQAFALGDYPNDPAERLVFIEGYAHTGNWDQALSLSQEVLDITKVMQPIICTLWERIDREIGTDPQEISQIKAVQSKINCLEQ
ncbi:MAG: hypothetical protein JEZ06_16445 [Anaerolineaceae bacterium]|nr:hypothetical protein [Anaerolineaceae bacterium]